jgi:hypothetical protein
MNAATMSPLDLCDHLHTTRDITEGIFMATRGLADVDERNALGALLVHLKERLDVLAEHLDRLPLTEDQADAA